MSPEERELLNKVVTLTEENNKILHSMRKGMRWSSIARYVYWVFIIGSAVGAYYLIQPYVDQFKGMYNEAKTGFDNLYR